MSESYKIYSTWSPSVRWFHWINVVSVIGPASARFSAFLPGKEFMKSLKSYYASLKAGKPQQFIRHNPLEVL